MPDISATHVREMLSQRDPAVSALVPRPVLGYIAAHGLYGYGT
jgi:nicotinic acid mononucleotide adenylyltransferase